MFLRFQTTKISGKKIGRKIGIPTINFALPKGLDIKGGVYAGWIVLNKKYFPAAIHFGKKPTFADSCISLEAHLLVKEFKINNVKKAIIELKQYIRPTMKFKNQEHLVGQVNKDIKKIKKVLEV